MAEWIAANIHNWHRYFYLILAGLLSVCLAVLAGTVKVPPELEHVAPYAGIVAIFLGSILTPRAQTKTGPGGDDLISPPPK